MEVFIEEGVVRIGTLHRTGNDAGLRNTKRVPRQSSGVI